MKRLLSQIFAFVIALNVASTGAYAMPQACGTDMEKVSGAKDQNKKDPNEKVNALIDLYRQISHTVDERLAPYPDPFYREPTFEGKLRVYRRLAVRPQSDGTMQEFPDGNGRLTTDTPSEQMRKLLNRNIGNKQMVLDERLLKLVLDDAQQNLNDPSAKRATLYSVAMGLRLTEEYLRKFIVAVQEVDRDGKPVDKDKKEEEKKKEEKKKDDKKKDQKKQPAKPKMPQLPKDYKAHTKDTDQQGEPGPQEEKWVVAESNFDHLYFKVYNLNYVARENGSLRFRADPIPETAPVPPEYADTGYKLTFHMAGEKRADVFHPPGFELLQPADPRAKIHKDQAGHYVITTDLDTVEIPLRPAQPEVISPEAVEFFTRPVGFQEKDFPEKMRVELFRRLEGKRPAEIAKQVENYIRTEFKYSVDKKAETDPVDSMKKGAFQCDIAAGIMVGVLRDIYHIPARVIDGFRALNKKGASRDSSYLAIPGEAHAWVEVLIDDQWVTYDPTPIEKDRKQEQKGGGEDEFQQKVDESIKPPQKQDEDNNESDGQSGQGEGQSGKSGKDQKDSKDRVKDHQKKLDENSKKSIDQNSRWEEDAGKSAGKQGQGKEGQGQKGGQQKGGSQSKQAGSQAGSRGGRDEFSENEGGHSGSQTGDKKGDKRGGKEGHGQDQNGKEGNGGKGAKPGDTEDGTGWTREELEKKLDIGSLSLKNNMKRNPFIDRAFRVLLSDALKPTHTRSESLERLSRIGPMLRDSRQPVLTDMAKDAIKVLNMFKGGGLADLVEEVRNRHKSVDVNLTFARLQSIIRQLELYERTLDPEGPVRPPRELLATLRQIRAELFKLDGANSAEIAAVRDFMKYLPPLSRSIIKETYGLTEVGRNAPTAKVAKDLKSGKLADYQLVSTLSPYTNFILDVEPKPEYSTIKTYNIDRSKLRGRDMVPVEDIRDMYKGLRLQPHKSFYDNFREGTLFIQRKRQTVDVPRSFGDKDDVERITIVAYDTSGSMGGNPGDFQAGLIAAFVDNALSDMTPTGKHRHKAMLMGFDTEVHTKIPVTSAAEAKSVIRSYRQKLANSGGGTDIQDAIMQAFAAIADAQKKHGEPLRKANIIIMTDGQSSINFEELRKARLAIDRKTPVEIMFVAINQSSPELMDFAINSGKGGLNKGFYKEFTGEHIEEFLEEARTLKLPPEEEAFHSEKTAADIPPQVERMFDVAASQARSYASHLAAESSTRDPKGWKNFLETTRQPEQDKFDRPVEAWMVNYRGFMMSQPTFKDKRLLFLVVDDFMKNFNKLSNTNFDSVSHHEMEQVRHYLDEAYVER